MSIKRLDPKATFELICELDSALQSETPEELAAIKEAKGQTRYEQYLESLDESKLLIRDGEKPDRFVFRCLKNSETAELQTKHMQFNPETKSYSAKNDALYLFDVFDRACLGLRQEDGSIDKINSDELGFSVAVNIGGAISIFTASGRHVKKQ